MRKDDNPGEDSEIAADFRTKKRRSVVSAVFLILAFLLLAAIGVLIWRLVSVNRMYDRIEKNATDFSRFEEMREKNPEVVAWLTVDGTKINTVVTQAEDNAKYLNTDVFGEFTFAGNPFLDYRNDKQFTDRYSIIYGHRMERRLMFSDLELFLDEAFWQEERTGTLELTDGTKKSITFFACKETTADDTTIFDPRRVMNNWKEAFFDEMLEGAFFAKDAVKPDDRILVLSTCEDALSENRIVLFGKLK